MTGRAHRLGAALALLGLVAACGGDGAGNFSQFAGFAAYFDRHPPAEESPDAATRQLLQRHKPRLFIAEGQEPPLHFYDDYIAHGTLTPSEGEPITAVDQARLNAHKTDPGAIFVHAPPAEPEITPTAFAKAETWPVRLPAAQGDGWLERDWTFLSYYFAFRSSGLPAGLPQPLRGGLGLLGWLEDWHQLDHYTHAVVVLDSREEPVAVLLQQHNYLHSFVVGEGITLDDGRPVLDAARYSNELYPHNPDETRHRAVRFLSPDTVDYLVAGRDRPLLAADEITQPDREVSYELAFPAPADAFYSFQGFLGERRLLPGRDGPPGARYNAWPTMKPKPVQLLAHYWHGKDEAYIAWYKQEVGSRPETRPDLAAQAERFAQALRATGWQAP